MAYGTIGYGSSGDDVRRLQQSLIDAGYNLGDAGASGQFDDSTQAALRQYQQDNGLTVDGSANDETLGRLYGTGQPQSTPADYYGQLPTYDAESDAAYQNALAALQNAQSQKPMYGGTYDSQLEDIYNQIVNRDKFSYDINSDMLYQQYKDQYVNMGQLAMRDTMGQAAALTGGYGSTYSQSAGQQQYDAYLQQLNDVVPELYGMALDQYNAEGDQLRSQYAMLGDMRDTEYGMYQDELSDYWRNVSYLQGQADDAYDRGIDAENRAYNRLMELITSSGYTPTEEEIAAAGLTQDQINYFLTAWNYSNPDLAYQQGNISAEQYHSITGKYPAGYTTGGGMGGYWGGGGGPGKASGTIDFDYSGFDAGDWESYFARIRNSEGVAAAETELDILRNKIPRDMLVYAGIGARGRSGH